MQCCQILLALLLMLPALPSSTPKPGLGLTSAQQHWLAAHPSVRASAISNVPPLSLYRDGMPAGLGIEMFQWAMDQLGIEVEWVIGPTTWQSLRQELIDTTVDIVAIAPVFSYPDECIIYTHTVREEPLVIALPERDNTMLSLGDLAGHRVATIRYSILGDLLRDKLPEQARILEYPNIGDALVGLAQGETDASVTLLTAATHTIQQQRLSSLKINDGSAGQVRFAMALRADWPELRDMLNLVLKQRTSGQDSVLLEKWTTVRFEHTYPWSRLIVGVVLGLAIFGSLSILLWRRNRQLRTEIQQRQLTEERLARNQRETSSFLRIIDDHVFFTRTDTDGIITYVSSAYCQFLGWSHSEMLGQTFRMVRHPETPKSLYQEMWLRLQNGRGWEGELRNRKRNGESFWVSICITPVLEDGKIAEYQATLHDITARKRLEALSVTDDLTGLFNRRHFNETYPRELRRARRESTNLMLAILDIDNFKKYNDTYGHQQGDFVLQAIGEVLQQHLRRPSDFAFRLGGEEFAIISSGQSRDEARKFLESLLQNIRDLRIDHTGNPPGIATASLGGLLISRPDPGLERVYYQRADQSLYKAKKQGRDQVELTEGDLID